MKPNNSPEKGDIANVGSVAWQPDAEHIATLSCHAGLKKGVEAIGSSQTQATRMLLTKTVFLSQELLPNLLAIGSAKTAIENKGGNCMAHTKVISGLLASCGINTDVYFDGTHFWNGLNDGGSLWFVDGYYGLVKRGTEPTTVATKQSDKPQKYLIGKAHDGYFEIDATDRHAPHLLGTNDRNDWQATKLSYSDTLDVALSKDLEHLNNGALYIPYGVAGLFMRDYGRSHNINQQALNN